MLNREKKFAKDIANVQAQAREQYPRNKTMMKEYEVQEKATEHPSDLHDRGEEEKEDIARDKTSE